jgi:hypothetical protein
MIVRGTIKFKNFSRSHEFTFERSRESVSGTFDDASHEEKLAALVS